MKVSNYARPGSAAVNAPSTPGSTSTTSGASLSVSDGTTTVSPASSVHFTSGATVTNGGGGVADVAVTGGISGIEVKETDGTPDVTGVTVVQVPPGGLTNNTGGNVTVELIPNRGPIERVHVEAAVGATYTLDWSVAATQDLTLTTGCTISFSNVPSVSGFLAAQTVIIRGNHTTTWPGAVTWENSLAPFASANALLVTLVSEDGGTIVGGTLVGFVNEAGIILADVTTDNVSSSAHGFAPKAPADATKYLDGTGAWSVPPGSGGGGALVIASSHSTPLVFGDIVQNSAQDDFIYSS